MNLKNRKINKYLDINISFSRHGTLAPYFEYILTMYAKMVFTIFYIKVSHNLTLNIVKKKNMNFDNIPVLKWR